MSPVEKPLFKFLLVILLDHFLISVFYELFMVLDLNFSKICDLQMFSSSL